MSVLCIAAILLYGSLTAAQDNHVRNFQLADKNSTHITFTWYIVDGYYSSRDISYFYLSYLHRSFASSRWQYISYRSTTSSGATFSYTSSLEPFINGPYIMQMEVYRQPPLYPRYTYSKKTYVKISIGQVDTYIILELKVHLHPTLTCPDFLLGSRSHSSESNREVERIIQKNCQCTLPYEFSVDGYFTCTASDFVVFRAKLSTHDTSNALDLAFLAANLSNLFARQDKTQITINGGRYFIEPGPCGLTVPQLTSQHCLDSAPTLAVASTSHQDNTVTTVVAITSAAMVLVVLSGCIVCLVLGLRKINSGQINSAKVKATCNLEMAAEGYSRNIQLQHGNEHVHVSPDISIQDNPSYGYGMAK